MRQVFKYQFHGVGDSLMVGVPLASHDGPGPVVHVAMQHERPTVWIEADPSLDSVPRTFVIVGTGQTIPPQGRHCGTFFDGPFVWHVYEVPA